MISFKEKLKYILKERKISLTQFSEETGINRVSFFYKEHGHKPHIYMSIAYYLGMTVEELIKDTDMEDMI